MRFPLLLLFPAALSFAPEIPASEQIRPSVDSYQYIAPECYALIVDRWAREAGVPLEIAVALAYWESRWNRWAVSKAGAKGLFQIMPENHAKFAWRYNGGQDYDEFDPEASSRIGLAYLADLHRQFGTWRKAIMAYNCGPNFYHNFGWWPKESIDLSNKVLSN